MKKAVILFLAVLTGRDGPVLSAGDLPRAAAVRSQDPEVGRRHREHGAHRRSGQVFWPIYRKYEAELTTLNDQTVALIKDYAQNYEKMTDAKADALTKQVFAIHGARLKLQEKYYGEFAKALSPVLAAKYMQIERQITAALDLQIASQLPLAKKSE